MWFQCLIEENGINMLDTAYCTDEPSSHNLMDTIRAITARYGQVKIHTRYINNPYTLHPPPMYYVFDVILTVHRLLICGNKMPTRCNRRFYCRSYRLLNMFRAPLCPSSGAQEYYTAVAACGISCCGFQVAGLVWS